MQPCRHEDRQPHALCLLGRTRLRAGGGLRGRRVHIHGGGLFNTGFGRAGRTRGAADVKRIVYRNRKSGEVQAGRRRGACSGSSASAMSDKNPDKEGMREGSGRSGDEEVSGEWVPVAINVEWQV